MSRGAGRAKIEHLMEVEHGPGTVASALLWPLYSTDRRTTDRRTTQLSPGAQESTGDTWLGFGLGLGLGLGLKLRGY